MQNYFEKLFQRICGYIRINSLSDDDYYNIIDIMNKKNFLSFIKNSSVEINYIYYKIDLFMLSYYTNYNYQKSTLNYDKVRLKVRDIYDRISTAYPEYFNISEIDKYDINETTSIYEIIKYFSIITTSGYPHQVLVFSYLKLLNNWTVKKILDKLSHYELEKIYINFINYYSEQTGYPVYIVYMFTSNLTESLNTELKNIITKNDSITPRKMNTYLEIIVGKTILNYYYGVNKINDISDWSIKVKKRIINNFIKEL